MGIELNDTIQIRDYYAEINIFSHLEKYQSSPKVALEFLKDYEARKLGHI